MLRADELSLNLDRELDRLDAVRRSADEARLNQQLKQRDIDHIYESTFLNAVGRFEDFLESLFYSVLAGDSGIASAGPLHGMSFRSKSAAEGFILTMERGTYLAWMPVRNSMARSEAFLQAGRPFSRLKRREDIAVLGRVTTIRNAIAHTGSYAREKFREQLQTVALPPRRSTPAGFLQSTGIKQSNHEEYFAELRRISRGLTASSDRTAVRYLRSEAPYQSGNAPGRGTYSCTKCGTTTRVTSDQVDLSVCDSCSTGPCQTCGRLGASTWDRVTR